MGVNAEWVVMVIVLVSCAPLVHGHVTDRQTDRLRPLDMSHMAASEKEIVGYLKICGLQKELPSC